MMTKESLSFEVAQRTQKRTKYCASFDTRIESLEKIQSGKREQETGRYVSTEHLSIAIEYSKLGMIMMAEFRNVRYVDEPSVMVLLHTLLH